MSKRLQVLVDERELRMFRQIARRHRMTVAEWVRQTLRASAHREPRAEEAKKLGTIRAASAHQFPTGDIAEMLSEIERGYAPLVDR